MSHLEHLADLPHYVYRVYDDVDRLLYIGCTYQIETRLKQHQSWFTPWAPYRDRVTVEMHPNRAQGMEAEKRAIAAEDPVYNWTGLSWLEQRARFRGYVQARQDRLSMRRHFPWETAVFAERNRIEAKA